jgi:hypothetical protein
VPIVLLAAIRHGFEDVLVEADLPVLMLRPFDGDGEGGLTALPRLLARQARNAIVLASPSLWQAPEMIGQAMSAGMRGDGALARKLTRQAEAMVLPAAIGAALCGIQFVRGVTAIGARRYDEAFDHLSRMFDHADPAYQAGQGTWALGDLAEAGARSGRADEAREILAAFRPAERDGVTAWTRVALLYAAPLLADEDDAEREFRRAPGLTWAAGCCGWNGATGSSRSRPRKRPTGRWSCRQPPIRIASPSRTAAACPLAT